MRATLIEAQPFAALEYFREQIAVRLKRQEILRDAARPQFWVILHEHVLRLPVGGHAVMAAQLQHIAALASHGDIVLQVLPTAEGAHASMGAMLTLMEFEDTPPVAYTETSSSGTLMAAPTSRSRMMRPTRSPHPATATTPRAA
ncbi:DUF5753 domain-containing protein [Streptomyces sp. NPDC007088]|uniref:DUF5753 domain-containing protein n=1 Tax=Streptomyces sp. NPDC007088 TaxID=3364773 RepID=UPI0036C9A15B